MLVVFFVVEEEADFFGGAVVFPVVAPLFLGVLAIAVVLLVN